MKASRTFGQFLPHLLAVFLLGFLVGCRMTTQSTGQQRTVQAAGAQRDFNTPEACIERGRLLMAEDDFEGAKKAFTTAMQLDPHCLPAYTHLALAHRKTGKLSEAEAVYRHGLKTAGGDSGLWTGYGYCLLEKGKENDALAAFRKSIELQTDPAEVASARLGVGAILNRRGDLPGANSEIEKAATWNPELRHLLQQK